MTVKKYFDLIMPEIQLPENYNQEFVGDAIRILSTDDIKLRKSVFKIATFFKREFHFDSFQYASSYDKEDDEKCHAYLWTVEKNHTKIKSVVVGGFCFRKREWEGYGLQWIWIHPYLRNTGLLSRHWSTMEEKFGKDFYVEPPYSLGMNNFLLKKDNKLHTQDPEIRNPKFWYQKEK